MMKNVKSVLYVRLPCWKIYPGGVVYVADYIHKKLPHVKQEILDLALLDSRHRKPALQARIENMRPDIVAFSWRNMQTFGPHPENDALDVVMNYDYSDQLWSKLVAAGQALSIIYDYAYSRITNFSLMRMVRSMLPDSRIVVGGTAVSIFAEYIIEKCPTDSTVVVGEGEDAMLSIIRGAADTVGEYWYKNGAGIVSKHERQESFELTELSTVNFSYIKSIFPEFPVYLDDYIGVQTKRGCPYKCHFCLYNSIEGCRQRYRQPGHIADEIEILNKEYGVKKIWFTDAQFCSTLRSARHVEKILDEMIARNIDVQWSGYLRFNHINREIAHKMFESGLCSIDTTFAGSENIIKNLTLGYSLEQQMEVFQIFRDAGYSNQKVKLYMPLNAPGETCESLHETIERVEELYSMFGRENVLPFIFFIGIQPGTPVENLLINSGYLRKNYNPLSYNPFLIKKLLYNPPPLGRLIGRSYIDALTEQGNNNEYIGRTTMDLLKQRLAQKNVKTSCTRKNRICVQGESSLPLS